MEILNANYKKLHTCTQNFQCTENTCIYELLNENILRFKTKFTFLNFIIKTHIKHLQGIMVLIQREGLFDNVIYQQCLLV